MKKLVTLLLAAGLVFAASTPSKAIEIKPFGMVDFGFEFKQNAGGWEFGNQFAFQDNSEVLHNTGTDQNHPKYSRAVQRFILGADIVASESLSAHIDFIAGFFTWGGPSVAGAAGAAQGGVLGGRSVNIVTRQAYMDWIIPNTKASVRMGLFAWVAPRFAVGTCNPFQGDEFGTGIQVNVPFNKNVSATFGWLRASSDNRRAGATLAHSNDLFDMFTLTLPVRLDGFRFTPWGVFGMTGKNSAYGGTNYAAGTYNGNHASNSWMPLRPAANAASVAKGDGAAALRGDSTMWVAGIGGEMTKFDPFRFAFDFSYSSLNTKHSYTDRAGWLGGVSFEYKTKYGVPTLKAWYASGDDSNINDGSERPILSGAFRGGANKMYGGNIVGPFADGYSGNAAGTWGVSLQWNNFSFINKLTHNFHVTYARGTNSKSMAQYADPHFVQDYMTKGDSFIEVDFESSYRIYQNLTLNVEMAYIFENFDEKNWGRYHQPEGRSMQFSDSAYLGINFRYTF